LRYSRKKKIRHNKKYHTQAFLIILMLCDNGDKWYKVNKYDNGDKTDKSDNGDNGDKYDNGDKDDKGDIGDCDDKNYGRFYHKNDTSFLS